MSECDLRGLEECSRKKFVVKPVYDGARSKGRLLHLLPEQREVALSAGTVYCPGVGATFGLKNTGGGRFQMLVLLAPGTGGAS
ncbi:MAG: hypothetical protein JO250_23440 [Armatimonadetes bacterium]|nr:hypothetical protein [Armatimonadota bacterium]